MKLIAKIKHLIRPLKVLHLLGYFRSVWEEKPFTLDKKPLPWLTYPAIEFLKGLDFQGKTIFEFGCGNSTLFWIEKGAARVVGVENNSFWYNLVSAQIKDRNVSLHLALKDDEYANTINQCDFEFDLILIDGEIARYQSAVNAVKKIKKGGVIILDNSDHYKHTAGFLRQQGLIQVDMSGFGPVRSTVWVTSFFFSRDYNFQPVNGMQPQTPVGGTVPAESERVRIEGA